MFKNNYFSIWIIFTRKYFLSILQSNALDTRVPKTFKAKFHLKIAGKRKKVEVRYGEKKKRAD